MTFNDFRLNRTVTPRGEETSIDVLIEVGSQLVRVPRSTTTPDLKFQRFLDELNRFLDLAVSEELDAMRAAWAPPGGETDEE